MRKTILLITMFLGLTGTAWADTLDYWHVFYNDALLLQCNSASEDPEIIINLDQVAEGDSLFIRYGDDTPCGDCMFVILVRDDEGRILGMDATKKFWGKIGFDLRKLTGKRRRGQQQDFHFYYSEYPAERLPDNPPSSRILTMRLE